MYLASVVESATVSCLELFQLTAPQFRQNTNPNHLCWFGSLRKCNLLQRALPVLHRLGMRRKGGRKSCLMVGYGCGEHNCSSAQFRSAGPLMALHFGQHGLMDWENWKVKWVQRNFLEHCCDQCPHQVRSMAASPIYHICFLDSCLPISWRTSLGVCTSAIFFG